MQALIPDWMRAHPEVYTWRSAMPVVCFNFVHMHHIDRVIRQYGGEQPVPRLPVDVTRYMSSIGREDDVWRPQRLSTWYEGWQRRRSPEVLVTVHFGGDPRGTQQYYVWFARVARRGRFLSRAADLADPRWTLGPAGIPEHSGIWKNTKYVPISKIRSQRHTQRPWAPCIISLASADVFVRIRLHHPVLGCPPYVIILYSHMHGLSGAESMPDLKL
ncbi:hypothetical protein PIB30_053454 [Stylosanthes scabra]|uniref:Aminotransferase-like plant mobile domain-containing protein n=1 Tax=Stylosanthes scabra TaxID=79078 RepID=A0ABU6TJ21_9FABA|nr:hypothetical protein [Stylosanthes scabra]